MNFLAILNNKLFKQIGIGIAVIIALYFAYYKLDTILTNNITLRENNYKLKTQIDTLKANLETNKLECIEQLKQLDFKKNVEVKKTELEKKLDKYKTELRDENTKTIINTTNDKPIYFKF